MDHKSIELLAYVSALISYVVVFGFAVRKRSDLTSLSPITHRALVKRFSILYWLSPLLFIGLWGIIATAGSQPFRNIPSPFDVATSFVDLLLSGELIKQAAISFLRVMIGFVLASAIGICMGLLAGSFIVINNMIMPVNSFLRYIPPTAFISLLIVYFGVGETYKYAVIFFGVIFFIVQMIVDIVDDVDMRYIEIGKTSGYSNWEIFMKVIIPFSWPRILDVLRINLSAAWTFLVAAELIGSEDGLGHLIAISQRFLRIGDLYAGIITFGVIGLATDKLLNVASRQLFRWYYVELKR